MRTRHKIGLIIAAGILFLAGLARNQRIASTDSVTVHPAADRQHLVPESDDLREWITGKERDLSRGIELARQRSDRMRELIRSDPEQALRESLTLAEWSRLPPEIREQVEQPFSTVADVEVMVACGPDYSETFIQTRMPDQTMLETYVYGRRSGLATKNKIPIQGIRVGETAALRPDIFQRLDAADEMAALERYPVAVPDPGGDSAAALAGGKIFYFENGTALAEVNTRIAALEELPGPDSGSQALMAALLDGGTLDIHALETLAFDAAADWSGTERDMVVILVDFPDLTGSPGDPVTFSNALNTTVAQQIYEMSYGQTYINATVLPATYRMPESSGTYTDDEDQLYTDARTLAQNDGVDLSSYETVCVLFPHLSGFSWAGLASLGGEKMWLNGSTSSRVVTHELGHNYGASHASTWAVPGSNPVDPAGTATEYGDFSDIMGSGEVPEGHFNTWHKRHIGWLDAADWQTVTTSGTYRVYRSDDYQTTGVLKGLEIDKGDGGAYWLGLRQEYPEYETYGRGVYLLWKKPGDNRSYLLDLTPQSDDGKYDGGLALGQTYTDASAGIHITPVARGGQTSNAWMDITVNLGPFPGNSAPSASLSGPTSLGVQESALFSVAASDADGDELAYHWDIGDGLVKPNTSSIPVAWLSGSTATVSCVVSDMKGGTNRVSQMVVLSNPLANWTQRTTDSPAQLNDICVGNGRLVAVGRDYTTLYSDDGINWTTVIKNNIYLEGVVHDGTMFIAAGMDYDFGDSRFEGAVFTSSDGTAWTQRYLDGPDTFNDVAYGSGHYVAVGDNGTIIHSTDGISWSPVSSGTTTDLQGISFGDGVFVAVGDEGGGTPHVVLTSSDGAAWADHSSGAEISDNKWLYHVQYCNDRFLAGGWRSSVQYSTDQGETFSTTLGDDYDIPAFAYGNGIYLAAGNYYSSSSDINLISLDGATWSELETDDQFDRNAAVYFDGTFITVGDNGAIWQSDPVVAGEGGYAVWQLENGNGLGLDRDPFDDADFDGDPNIYEYAMGSRAADAGSVPAAGTAGESGGYFTVTYERDGIAPDIDYAVERAGHLASNDWSSANTVTLEESATNLTVRSVFPLSTQTNEFMRLNIDFKQ